MVRPDAVACCHLHLLACWAIDGSPCTRPDRRPALLLQMRPHPGAACRKQLHGGKIDGACAPCLGMSCELALSTHPAVQPEHAFMFLKSHLTCRPPPKQGSRRHRRDHPGHHRLLPATMRAAEVRGVCTVRHSGLTMPCRSMNCVRSPPVAAPPPPPRPPPKPPAPPR